MTRKWPLLIDFLAGSLTGSILSVFVILFLFRKARRVLRFTSILPKRYLFNLSSFGKKPPPTAVPSMESMNSKDLFSRSKAWVYELRHHAYDPSDFSFSITHLCLIELRKHILLISQPRTEPDHRLNDHELYSHVDFQRIDTYDLSRVTVSLAPKQMTRSNYWSKKSPIVLSHVLCLKSELIGNPPTDVLELTRDADLAGERTTLLFFPRTRRSKEDWFYRFVHASQSERWRNDIRHRLPQGESSQASPQVAIDYSRSTQLCSFVFYS